MPSLISHLFSWVTGYSFWLLGQHKAKSTSLHPPPSINSHMVEIQGGRSLRLISFVTAAVHLFVLFYSSKYAPSHFLYYPSFTWFTWGNHSIHPSRLGSSVSSERLLHSPSPIPKNQHPSPLCTHYSLTPLQCGHARRA